MNYLFNLGDEYPNTQVISSINTVDMKNQIAAYKKMYGGKLDSFFIGYLAHRGIQVQLYKSVYENDI